MANVAASVRQFSFDRGTLTQALVATFNQRGTGSGRLTLSILAAEACF